MANTIGCHSLGYADSNGATDGLAGSGVDRCPVRLGQWRRIAWLHTNAVPGTHNAADSSLKLARRTEWVDQGSELFVGLGQRTLVTDQTEIALTEARKILIESAEHSG